MSDIYQIKCKKKIYSGNSRSSIEEILQLVIVYDILPPFSVLKNGTDITSDFMSFAAKQGYIFINQYELELVLPKWLIKSMNKGTKKRIYLQITTEKQNILMHSVPIQDIKSIKGFRKLYSLGYIAFAFSDVYWLCYKKKDKTVCVIERNNDQFIEMIKFADFDELKDKIHVQEEKR